MSAGDTKLSICSDALIMLGASPLSSFSDGSDEAQVADRLYDDIRDTLLMSYPYSWSLKKISLGRLEDAPVNEWRYKFALPGDILGNPKAVFYSSAVGAITARDFELFSGGLYSNYEQIWIDYQFRPEPAAFPPYFANLLKHALASAFAEPVTDQITKGNYYHSLAYGSPSENMRGGLMRVAMGIDGRDRPSQSIQDFLLTDFRG